MISSECFKNCFKIEQKDLFFVVNCSLKVVALMGAHSLGGAHLSNSGYQGKWSGPQNIGFNELYYLNMVNPRNKWINVVR